MFNIVTESVIGVMFHFHSKQEVTLPTYTQMVFDSPLSSPIGYSTGASNSICQMVKMTWPQLCSLVLNSTSIHCNVYSRSYSSSLILLLPRTTHPISPKDSASNFLANPSIYFFPFILAYITTLVLWVVVVVKEVARNYWVLSIPLNLCPNFWSWVGKNDLVWKTLVLYTLLYCRNLFYLTGPTYKRGMTSGLS